MSDMINRKTDGQIGSLVRILGLETRHITQLGTHKDNAMDLLVNLLFSRSVVRALSRYPGFEVLTLIGVL